MGQPEPASTVRSSRSKPVSHIGDGDPDDECDAEIAQNAKQSDSDDEDVVVGFGEGSVSKLEGNKCEDDAERGGRERSYELHCHQREGHVADAENDVRTGRPRAERELAGNAAAAVTHRPPNGTAIAFIAPILVESWSGEMSRSK